MTFNRKTMLRAISSEGFPTLDLSTIQTGKLCDESQGFATSVPEQEHLCKNSRIFNMGAVISIVRKRFSEIKLISNLGTGLYRSV